MNPSAKGWIKKLLEDVSKKETYLQLSLIDFYNVLKTSGFIYGNNVSIVHNLIDNKDLTHEELCKANLFLSFYYLHNWSGCKEGFIDNIINFYNSINTYTSSFFEELLGEKKSSNLLEDMIDKRIQIDDNVITKNFNYFITNALLFVDVLAYKRYLVTNSISETYLKKLESSIETIIFTVLDYKKVKTKYDKSLIKLFESSLRYQNKNELTYDDVIKNIESQLGKYYITDLVCMAFWSDKIISKEEQVFLNQLGDDLNLEHQIIEQSVDDINTFFTINKDKIALLSSKNMMQSFYNNSSKMVNKLINRNSKRLLKELKESKELMVLISQSTTRKLTDEEQKKVQNQLLDIFKSIPSLAIFILPGGMLLLPLVIKFIPKLLPSSFDENRIDDE
ncbi:LETM1-related biofilm-associated protein [Ichthyenterobacterium magnum]|uniref:LETM1-like protein n=1 Tax=Ichthyenterobacterium magnum TaxID=1230530 RepID=A0A420DLB5_9FLAO|nr:LETM1-related biofilm-associated protein [Ichthyenterobacterium magnum]RKE95032.1 LETM1-like protein [Ichthyenterobacterium magnum]